MYFKFNDVIYLQKQGTPIGGCCSSTFSEIVMRQLETSILSKLHVTFYQRYVDDTIIVVENNLIEPLMNAFNNYHPTIQFTIERESNRTINFLDVTIIRTDNSFETNWYTKPSYAGIILNYESNHPYPMKKAIISNLIYKMIKLSDKKFYNSNLEKIQQLLLNNAYPLSFIQKHVKLSLKKYLNNTIHYKHNQNSNNGSTENLSSNETYFNLPYIPQINKKLKNYLKTQHEIQLINKLGNKESLIKHLKDPIPRLQKQNTVYLIECKDCDLQYIGQTKRKLQDRINEHKRNIKEHHNRHNSLTKHRIETQHSIKFDEPKILNVASNYYERLTLETLNIKIHKVMNSAIESNKFTNSYDIILSKFKNYQ